MSRGIGAFVKLVLEDSETVIYEFGSYKMMQGTTMKNIYVMG